ncbi:hypothetical protein [Ruegeria arenilitoris]|uniref:hypothetical protein n=1 Tax=Ruegeria arenilitoris TaxID=1173585 RepID=UPI00147AEFC8|nr:hypothetical protein [Ruegeria arenilitoris]
MRVTLLIAGVLGMCLSSAALAAEETREQRFIGWMDFVDSGNDSFSANLDAMLALVDGCELPGSICEDIINVSQEMHKFVPHAVSARVLSSASLGFKDITSACLSERAGIVQSWIIPTGTRNFVIMSNESDAHTLCFVRDLGAS